MDVDDEMDYSSQQLQYNQSSRSGRAKQAGRRFLATLHNLFASTNPSVRRLLGMRQCPDNDSVTRRAEKELDYLARKLKDEPSALEELERVVSRDCPEQPGLCVTLPRSADGRIQVAHYKALPHFVYCRLWRWPDLQSHHELRPQPFCRFPYSSKRNKVCVNPYHYRRPHQNKLVQVVVPRLVPSDVDASSSNCSSPEPVGLLPQPQQQQQQFQGMPSNVDLESQQPFAAWEPSASPSYPTSTMTSACYSSRNTSPGQQVSTGLSPYNPAGTCNTAPAFNVTYPNYNFEETTQYPSNMANATTVEYQEPREWATVAYYELNTRVGETFQCSHPIITVDGFTAPTNDNNRFCLGKLTNVNRNSTIENVRRAIGPGIQLHYTGGEVYVECHSDYPIFVQSRNYSYEHGYDPSTVVKVPPKGAFKIFDNGLFHQLLEDSVHKGFDSVYELTKMCTVRLSFVKGWGVKYHRQDVTGTPCWIEVHLNGPLKWLDRVLMSLGSSSLYISSVS